MQMSVIGSEDCRFCHRETRSDAESHLQDMPHSMCAGAATSPANSEAKPSMSIVDQPGGGAIFRRHHDGVQPRACDRGEVR